jgi:hypothetical protein
MLLGGLAIKPGVFAADCFGEGARQMSVGRRCRGISRLDGEQNVAEPELVLDSDRQADQPGLGKDRAVQAGPLGIAPSFPTLDKLAFLFSPLGRGGELAELAYGPGDVLVLVLLPARLAQSAAQGQVAGREGVLRFFLFQCEAEVLVRLVVALQPGQGQPQAAEQ